MKWTGRSWVKLRVTRRFPTVSVRFFINLIIPVALCLCGQLRF